eukprot:CAMPEP_0197847384 /NCGR_PEP_ID=MMETSP1438-20131217/5852_1 /TAXON_ID=1461541 /ORGANISM="Pterosperma sp., Strain CCMP1384" /LENGTH=139 /DNA_ID=CAMNT_0043459283 /DNA_START=401 /DNA_END=821 /DNA_ORIENTATION=+
MASAKLDFCGVHVPSGEYIMRNTTKGFVQAHGRCTTEDDTDIRDQYESVLDWREANEVPTPVKCKEQLATSCACNACPWMAPLLSRNLKLSKPARRGATLETRSAETSNCDTMSLGKTSRYVASATASDVQHSDDHTTT